MRTSLLPCTALATVLGATPALTGAAERAPWNGVRAEAIRGHVDFLASDLLEGRAAASRGYDIAAAYVAAQFRECGLAPGGDEDTYFQSVPLLEATVVLPGSAAELVHENDTHTFEYGTHYLPSADFASASSTLSAPLVFAGHGIEAPELEHDDFAGLEVKGRIAVVLSGAPERFPAHQRAYYSWSAKKWATLTAHGAVGAVTLDSRADARRVPWERRVAMSWTPQMRWLDAEGAPKDAFPELKLRFHFNHEAAARLFENAPTGLEGVLSAAESGAARPMQLPGMLTLSATTGLRRTESANVIGVLRGADAALADELVVLTAHLDHLGRGSAVNGDSIYNGAHDNALGVAILLEIARALNASGARPRRSVMFAAVTAEEKGLLGSDFLAQQAQAQGRKLIANVNVDMPLTIVPVHDFVALGAAHSTLGAQARSAAAAQGYRLSPDLRPEEVLFIRSDQFSFIRQGIPAIALHSGYRSREDGVDAEALQRQFLQADYHQPSDEPDLPIDYQTAADLARVNLRLVLEAANTSARPRWHSGDFFGERYSGAR